MVKERHFEGCSFRVIDAFYDVHNQMGAGLLESAYHQGLLMALKKRGLSFKSEVPLFAKFDGVAVAGYKADVVVAQVLIVAVNAVKKHDSIMVAPLIIYLYLSVCRLGC